MGMSTGIILSGLQQRSGVTFESIDIVEFSLGENVDEIEVKNTSEAIYVFRLEGGDDQLNLRSKYGHFVVYGGAGIDTVHVASTDYTLRGSSGQGLFTFDGGPDDSIFHLDDHGNSGTYGVANVTDISIEYYEMITVTAEGELIQEIVESTPGGPFLPHESFL